MTKPNQHEVSFLNSFGETLRGFYTAAPSGRTCIVFLHGFPGTSDYIVSRRMEQFVLYGCDVLRFDFSGSGRSGGDFAKKRISKEVSDARAAIDFVTSHEPRKNVILVGHSTGAIVGALYGHVDPRVRALVLLAGVSDLVHGVRYDFTEEQVREFETTGSMSYKRPGSWVDGKILEKGYLDEFYSLDVLGALKKLQCPCLIVHGSEDESVPWGKDPQELYAVAPHPKQLVKIEGADHKFTTEDHWGQVVASVVEFVESHGLQSDGQRSESKEQMARAGS